MRKHNRRYWREDSGSNLVEMALILPLLILLVGGIVDLGRAFNNYIVITNAAREGARYASHFPHYGDGIRQATILEAANSGVSLQGSDVTITPDPDGGGIAVSGQPILVVVEYDFPIVMGSIVGVDTLRLHTEAEMIVFGTDK